MQNKIELKFDLNFQELDELEVKFESKYFNSSRAQVILEIQQQM